MSFDDDDDLFKQESNEESWDRIQKNELKLIKKKEGVKLDPI